MNDHAVAVEKVTKRYGAMAAVAELSMTVEPGERVVLVGHNGAGKTTLFNIVLGLTRPTAGVVTIFGAPPGSHSARTATAFLPENVSFNGALSGQEILKFCARLKGAPPGSTVEVLETVGLADASNRAVRTYSKGMRQRLGLAQALIGSPRLLVLDEPTSGLDPVSRERFYEIVDGCAREGTTVLTSSHALTELEAHADRIVIMRSGALVAGGTLSSLRQRSGLPTKIRVRAADGDDVTALADQLAGRRINGQTVELDCQPGEVQAHVSRIAASGTRLSDVEIVPPGLNEIYLHYSAQDDREALGDA